MGRYRYDRGSQEQFVEDESQHPIGADVRVLHNLKDSLTIVAPTTKAVEEVGQPVLMQRSRYQQSRDNGEQYSNRHGQHQTGEVDNEAHCPSCYPARQRPMLHHRLVALLRRLVQSPERQPREEDQRRPDAVVPLGLVNTCLHIYLIFLRKGTKFPFKRKKKNGFSCIYQNIIVILPHI